MSLKVILENLTNPFFTSRTTIKRSRLDSSVKNALENFSEFEVARPSKLALQKDYLLANKLKAQPDDWRNISNKSLRNFAWLLLSPLNDKNKPLIEQPNFLKQFRNELNGRRYINGWLTLYYAIIMDYPYENQHFSVILRLLSEIIKSGYSDKAIRVWNRCQQFGLLEINATELVVAHLNEKNTLEDVFQKIGLFGNLLNSRFCEQVYVKFLEKKSEELTRADNQFIHIRKIISESMTVNGELKYKECSKHLIEALLTPFAITDAEKKTKQFIKNFILKTFNDPRTKKDNWMEVDKRALDIFLSWMVDDTLKDFFTIMKYNSQFPNADRHWKTRRAFYKAYLDIKAIDEAWIVAGNDAEEIKSHFCIPNMNYGQFSLESSEDCDSSALIMRIKNIVLVEWSCIEKYRLWNYLSSDSPLFYKKFYHYHELNYSPIFEAGHIGTTRGEWQDVLSNYIKDNTGRALIFHEYL